MSNRSIRIFPGDCRHSLGQLADNSIACVITSPPYYGLRDYKTDPAIWGGEANCQHEWADSLCEICGAWLGNFGLEPTPQLYIEHAVEIFWEVRRVLRKDGTLWLNMGDSYVSAPPGNKGKYNTETDKDGAYSRRGNRQLGHGEDMGAIYAKAKASGLKNKDLIGMPWRLALALQADGWYLRQDIIWHKPNPMPESTTDRCTKSHEYLFMLSKSAKYYYDQEAIAEPVSSASIVRVSQSTFDDQAGGPKDYATADGQNGNSIRKALKNFKRTKPATGGFLNTLMDAPSKSGNKARKVRREHGGNPDHPGAQAFSVPWSGWTRNKRSVWTIPAQPFPGSHFAVFPPALVRPCILAGSPEGGVVMDPFGGSGTVALVASQLGRSAVLCELNPEYVEMAKARIEHDAGLTLFMCPVTIEKSKIERPRGKNVKAAVKNTGRRLSQVA